MSNAIYEKMKADSAIHALEPEAGDYWQEMYCPIAVVLEVRGDWLTICKKTIQNNDDTWSWNLEEAVDVRASEFAESLKYKSDPSLGFWANVLPRAHADCAEYWREHKNKLWASKNYVLGLA